MKTLSEAVAVASLSGRVISGRGGSYRSRVRIKESPVSDFLGELPVPGSLNVALDGPVRFDPGQVAFSWSKRAFYWGAELNGMRCLISRATGHPLHVVEIISACRLRDRFQLNDGDLVEIKILSSLIVELSWGTRAIWSLFWWRRGSWYSSSIYRKLIGPFWLLRRRATQSPSYRAKLWNHTRPCTGISVCHINLARDPKLRGGERQTQILVDALSAEGVSGQRVIVLERKPLANRFSSSPELEVCRVRNRISAVFACRGASLLHAHEAHAAQVAFVASLLFGKRYLITRRFIKLTRSNSFTSAVYRNARTVIALTRAVESALLRRFPDIPTVRIPDAWNPVSPDPDAVRKLREKFEGKFLIGHIAAMDGPGKGHSVLLQSARRLHDDFPDLQFLLLGSGSLEKALREQAAGLKNVHFCGWVEDPFPWIGAFDLFAFPSLVEALGSTLLDALRAGIPVVASRVGGIPEIISEDCGVLVPPGDPEALAKQLLRLYRSDSLMRNLSAAGVMHSARYSPASMAKQYIRAYRSVGLALD